jgi:serine/threonine-protein kinase
MKTCPVCDTPYPDPQTSCPTDGAVLIESRELAPGQIVRSKYRVVRKLGQGGMGEVYLAEHLMLGGQLALKFLASELSRSPQFIKRFRQEARAAYQLRHPNIVEVADLDQDEGGSLFIAMEFVDGPSLRAILRKMPDGLPAARALRIVQGVAAGLAAAHARSAIHRDIKPENIMLASTANGGEQAKVLDFGIAAMAEGITNFSRTRGLLLTPEYAAPEQWRGTPAAELDGRADLYALGGVFYELLVGQTPFHAANMEGWMFQHLQGVPEPLGKLRPDLARDFPWLEAVIMRLLARDREDRFPSAMALLEALTPMPSPPRPATVVEPTPLVRPTTVLIPDRAKVEQPLLIQMRVRTSRWAVAAAVFAVGLGAWFAVQSSRPKPATTFPVATASPAFTPSEPERAAQEDPSGTWTDIATGLMWAKADNGRDLNWRGAISYCRNLKLGGYSDWRLPAINELRGIYNPAVDIEGLWEGVAQATWHVKGNLQLSGRDWSTSPANPPGAVWTFDFSGVGGVPGDTGWVGGHALCVR